MERILNFPKSVFSEKEIGDFKRRTKVVKLLRGGERWKKIKEETGAHLQTIAIIAKRLKKRKRDRKVSNLIRKTSIFIFGQSVE